MWWDDEELPEDDRYVRHLPLREMLRRVTPLFRSQIRRLLTGVALLLISVGAELVGPLLLLRIIDVDIATRSTSGIARDASLYAASIVIWAGASYFQVVVLTKMGLAIVTSLKNSLFSHLLGLSLAYFDKNPPGRLMARVESDTERLQALFSEVAIQMFRTVVFVVGVLIVLLALNWQVTVTMVALITPIGIGSIFYFRWMRGLFRRVRALYARVSAFVSEYVQGIPILQVFGYERQAAGRLAQLNDDKLRLERNTAMLEYSFFGFLSSIEVVAIALIVFLGLKGFLGVAITAGMIAALVDYTRRVFWPLTVFSEHVSFIQRSFASADRVFGILETPSRTPDLPNALEVIKNDWKEVAFENVSFAYDGGTKALDNVSFRIRRGERIALVGLSGGGKTTITSLLLRFYEPTGGRITLDGRDIRTFRQKIWRERIGLVLQDIHLFPGTVDENLRALADGIPDENLSKAVRIVGAEEVIERLPNGYKESLAEGGTNLSMGERQLLSFARAIVRDPDLLVLDEATSSVDPATERKLQESVDRLLAGRTSLIIAHRLATIVSADRILVLHGGRLVEEGTHEDLYKREGIYRDLFELQFKSGAVA